MAQRPIPPPDVEIVGVEEHLRLPTKDWYDFFRVLAQLTDPATATAALNVFTTTLKGLVPPPAIVAGKVLSDNATWVAFPAAPPTPMFTVSYTSAPQTITAAGQLVLPHSLGMMPKLIQTRLKNTITEGGYAVGDEVVINPAGNDPNGTASRGLSIVPDATNITIRYGSNASSIAIINKTNGNSQSITVANWQMIVMAWA